MNITEKVAKIQEEIRDTTHTTQNNQFKMLEQVTEVLDSMGVSLDSRFEIPLSARISPPHGFYR